MTKFMYAYTPPNGEVWSDPAIASLVGQNPAVTGLRGPYVRGVILAAVRGPGRELHITVQVPDDVKPPLPAPPGPSENLISVRRRTPEEVIELMTIKQVEDAALISQLRALIASADEYGNRHVIDLREDGWTIAHPLSCRAAGLFACPVNAAAEGLGRLPEVGRFEVTVEDGDLVIGERVQASPRAIQLEGRPSKSTLATLLGLPERRVEAELWAMVAELLHVDDSSYLTPETRRTRVAAVRERFQALTAEVGR